MRRFNATATITTNTSIPTSHGQTGDLRSIAGAGLSATLGFVGEGAGVEDFTEAGVPLAFASSIFFRIFSRL